MVKLHRIIQLLHNKMQLCKNIPVNSRIKIAQHGEIIAHWQIGVIRYPKLGCVMGPVCLMKFTRKQKLVRKLGFFLDFFPQLILTTGS